jgi:alpha-glucosidase (family GH31 glycosyl hydrolase)
MKRYDWCSFSWDPEAFPDPKKYLTDIKKEYNVKVCAWINPYISQRADIFQEGVKNGYFVKRTNGDVWQWYVVCSNPPIDREG